MRSREFRGVKDLGWRYRWLAQCIPYRFSPDAKRKPGCGYVEIFLHPMKYPYLCRKCGNRTTPWRGYVCRRADGSLKLARG